MSTSVETAGSKQRFTSLLEARARGSAPGVRELRSSTIDDVSARIRDGRTDAADASDDMRDAVRERDPADEGAEPEGEERPEERREPREGREERERQRRRPSRERGSDDRGERAHAGGESLSSRERSIELTDASDARGAGPDEGAGNGSDVVGLAAAPQTLPQPLGQGPAAAIGGVRAVAGLGSVSGTGPAGAGSAGSAATSPVAPVGRAEAAKAASAARPAAAPRPGASTLERAEQILDQLKVHVRAGDREARIQLRPQELGLLDMRIKVEGGVVSAHLAAESAETLAVLEAHAPELRAWLTKDGVERVEVTFERLEAGADGGREQAAARDADAGRRRGGGRRSRSGAGATGAPLAGASAALARALTPLITQDGVDLVA